MQVIVAALPSPPTVRTLALEVQGPVALYGQILELSPLSFLRVVDVPFVRREALGRAEETKGTTWLIEACEGCGLRAQTLERIGCEYHVVQGKWGNQANVRRGGEMLGESQKANAQHVLLHLDPDTAPPGYTLISRAPASRCLPMAPMVSIPLDRATATAY